MRTYGRKNFLRWLVATIVGYVVIVPIAASASASERIWTDAQFQRGIEKTKKILEGGPPPQQVMVTLHIRPPFYKGSMPLQYKVVQIRIMAGVVRFVSLFEDFIVQYIYLDLDTKNYALANGARATDASDRVIAEAKLIDPTMGKPGFIIEERHYDLHGKVSFRCESHFGEDGFKVSETKVSGVKRKEYFFVWPMR